MRSKIMAQYETVSWNERQTDIYIDDTQVCMQFSDTTFVKQLAGNVCTDALRIRKRE